MLGTANRGEMKEDTAREDWGEREELVEATGRNLDRSLSPTIY